MVELVTVSVIICTHNPLEAYLNRVLTALAEQTFPNAHWELLLIDNASNESVGERYNISWHPNGRHIREAELGLTSARLRGITEAKAELLIFVDDDNVLASDYLECAYKISNTFPFLGAWGGQALAEYEIEPPEWLPPISWRLGVRSLSGDTWSNDPEHWIARPFGAGLCVRRFVAEAFVSSIKSDPRKILLGRRGQSLLSDEDHELVAQCVKFGLGSGTFERMRLIHLIPSRRLSENYFCRLIAGQTASKLYRNYLISGPAPIHDYVKFLNKMRLAKAFFKGGRRAAAFRQAELAGYAEAVSLYWAANKERTEIN
jgi:glycosyltransferase involved in cell wall biosynthesis